MAVGDADDEFDANPYVVKALVVGVDEDNVFIAVVDDTEDENAVVETVEELVVLRDVAEEVEVNVSILLDCP